jgi:hypothetical protein
MTFEEFERATPHDLREAAKDSFDRTKEHGVGWIGAAATLLEGQYYLAEIDRREAEVERRESKRIARRDFRMELVVIFLIGLELIVAIGGIVVGIRESREQSAVAQKQIEMLDKVEKAMMRAGNMMLIRP